jgi:hypothetical protein
MKIRRHLIALMLLTLVGCMHTTRTDPLLARAQAIANDLQAESVAGNMQSFVMSREFPDIVILANKIPRRLHALGPKLGDADIFVRVGDANGHTYDDRITHHIVFFTEDDGGLALRLRYDPDRDKFHMVGYCGATREYYDKERTGE